MTTRTSDQLVCECGHQGRLWCSENDAPFTALRETYSLEGFKGEHLTITSAKDMPDNIIAALDPICQQCGTSNKVRYADQTKGP